jgi:hypothetical protein
MDGQRLSTVSTCRWRSSQRFPQIRDVLVMKVAAEVKERLQDVRRPKVRLATSQVNEATRVEEPFLEEHEANAPLAPGNLLPALTAPGLAARSTLRTIDAWQTPLCGVVASRALQDLPVRQQQSCFTQRLEEGFRPLVRRTGQVKPERHLPFAEQVVKPLAKAQFALGDR